MPGVPNKLSQFWQELKRRNVHRLLAIYVGTAYLILEASTIIFPRWGLPDWTIDIVLYLLILGAIITFVVSWIWDITPAGVRKTKPASETNDGEMPTVKNGWKIATYLSLVVIVALIVINVLSNPKNANEAISFGNSIAVLPFTDMSSQKDQEYFCDGITEEIINTLTQLDGLKVIARTSSFAYKGKQDDIREIGRQLNVETILDGSIQKVGKRLRITAQLVNVSDGAHIWSQRFDREMEDVFVIQDEISSAIANNLKISLLGEKNSFGKNYQTDNMEAYNLYLKGRFFWYRRTKDDLEKSIYNYYQAVELDSTYALAYAGLADAYFALQWWGDNPEEEGFDKSREFALRALAIEMNIPEAHATLGAIATWYDWNWELAEIEFKKAIIMNPNYTTVHQYYAELLDVLGREEEAREHIDFALNLDPNSQILYIVSAILYYHSGQFEKAIEDSRNSLEITENNTVNLRIIKCNLNLGEEELAFNLIKDYVANSRYVKDLEELDQQYQESGIDGVKRWYIDWLLSSDRTGHINSNSLYFNAASLSGILGDTTKTIEYLERGFNKREGYLPHINNNPDFDFIREQPRFRALLGKMNL